ncbi:MAG: DUF177 domain-containing protein [Alphaproteobacteria bacterium]|nr:DUF177 domain-containing protein [Alphaproteobacteria bacterium]
MSEPTHEFRRPVAVAKISEAGLVQTLSATPAEFAQIANYLDIAGIKTLTARVSLTRSHGKGVHLTGTLKADVTQTCVVTLEPLDTHIEAAFERSYLPPDRYREEVKPERDVFVDPTADDPPEPLGHEIDLGEIVVEELALNLDPYPRKPGVAFQTDEAPARENPFAVLAKLKPKK